MGIDASAKLVTKVTPALMSRLSNHKKGHKDVDTLSWKMIFYYLLMLIIFYWFILINFNKGMSNYRRISDEFNRIGYN